MDLDALISQFGLIALFLGCFLEGESAAITGGVLAHGDLLPLWQVVIAIAAGAWCADNLIFFAGHRYRTHPRVIKLSQKRMLGRVLRHVGDHPYVVTALFRFVPGMRILAPLALAHTRVSYLSFAAITVVASSLWALFYATLGQAFAVLLARLYGELEQHEVIVIAGTLAAVGLLPLLIRYVRSRKGG